ncbi:MAG: hypothetical protein GY940_11415 [bacterium]|nr:hypothetical protein [bacterium]
MATGHALLIDAFVLFREFTDKQLKGTLEVLTKRREKEKKEKPIIRCVNCNHVITTAGDAIPVAGQHRHDFVNPAGIHYHIGCFSSARGCFNAGEPTIEFTWFPGYSWCYSVCGKCSAHLGWYFQSGDSHFYGLILDRLTHDRAQN